MHLLSGPVSDVVGVSTQEPERGAPRSSATSEAMADVVQRLELLEEAALSYEERLRVLEEGMERSSE